MKFLYRLSKIILIFTLIIFISLGITFTIIEHKLQYEMPVISIIKLYDKNNNEYLSLCNNNKQSYIKLDDVSGYLIDAFISLEDKSFYRHNGINLMRIIKATFKNIKSNKFKEGASTITQQYVKNLFLNSDKNIKRKLHEIIIAINIESKYTKEEILEGYLNSIYFDHGIYGVEDASIYYFNKSAKDLNLIEAASLASIPKSPNSYSPIKNPKNNSERRNFCLKEMLNDGLITENEYYDNIDKELILNNYNKKNDEMLAPWFQDAVIKILNTNSFKNLMNKSYLGYNIYTTLDLNLNNIIIKNINTYIPNDEIETSIIAVEPNTGNVLSLIGGKDYSLSTYNRAIYANRQPGSTVKPFLYLNALENGFTVASTFKSEDTTFYLNDFEYNPHNYRNIYPNIDIAMPYAIATSDNIYAMKTHLFLGEKMLANTLKRFGVNRQLDSIASLCLGTVEVSLFEMISCYQVLANLGIKRELNFINRIETMDKELIYEKKDKQNKLANSDEVYILNETMTSVFDVNMTYNITPTCASISSILTHKLAAKTGSTDTDNWIFGYNNDILIGVWSGYDDNRKINTTKETRFGKYIFASSIEEYLKNNNSTWYDMPNTVVKYSLNPITGFFANPEEYTKDLYFLKNNLPWFIELFY